MLAMEEEEEEEEEEEGDERWRRGGGRGMKEGREIEESKPSKARRMKRK